MANEALGSGKLNSRGETNVDARVPAEPLAFLRPETGEIIIVPAEDANALRTHYNGLSNMVAELQSAHRALQLCEDHLQELQIAKQTTITPKTILGEDLEGGASVTLGQWADNWNQAHQLERRGSASHGGAQIADIELSAEAQLMRFSYGGSLNGDLSLMDRRLSVKAEGHAAVDFAKAEAKLDLFFPRKDGWLWTVTAGDGTAFNLIAARCRVTVEVSGVVGASIAAELAMKIEVSPLDKNMPKAAGKRGRKDKKARRKQTVSINTNDEADVATLDASASAFAGVKANGTLTGELEWRDPKDEKKEFASIASIAPTVGGMAGIGAGAKFKIEYTRGIFRLRAHASLCVGVGAEGGLDFAVGAKQMVLFFRCLFYNIAYWQFKNLGIINEDAFDALKGIQFLAVKSGRQIESYFGEIIETIQTSVSAVDKEMQKANARMELATRILGNPESLKQVTPEAKGMLIYQLTRHGYADVVANGAVAGDNYLGPQRKAVLAVIQTAISKPELENIIQHVDENGAKGDIAANRARLRAFFKTEAIRDIDIPAYQSPYLREFDVLEKLAMNGDFDGWYQAFANHLVDVVPHGYALSDTLVARAQDLLGRKAAGAEAAQPDPAGPLGAAFGPVLRLTAQAPGTNDDLSLQRFLDRATALRLRLQQISHSADADAQARQMAQALFQGKASALADTQSYAQLVAASLGSEWAGMGEALFVRPIAQAMQTVLQPAQASLNAAWRQGIATAWGRSFAGRYPFADTANDASLTELARFLHPETGLLAAFLGTHLAGALELQGDQWVPVTPGGQTGGEVLAFDPAFLRAVNALQRVAAHMMAQSEPQYRFEVKPIPSPGLTETVLTLDGQKLHYYNQRERWQAMRWPANTVEEPGARLQWQSEAAGTNRHYEFGGYWGWVRMLERASIEPLDSATYQLTWHGMPETRAAATGPESADADAESLMARAARRSPPADMGYPVKYLMRTDVGQGPLELLALRGFVLPSRIFVGRAPHGLGRSVPATVPKG